MLGTEGRQVQKSRFSSRAVHPTKKPVGYGCRENFYGYEYREFTRLLAKILGYRILGKYPYSSQNSRVSGMGILGINTILFGAEFSFSTAFSFTHQTYLLLASLTLVLAAARFFLLNNGGEEFFLDIPEY
eukprot:scaffold843_cov143-Skeletonema_menzelii.AAC.10